MTLGNCDKITVFNSPHERCGIGEYGRGLNQAFRLLGITIEERSVQDMSSFARAQGPILVHFEPGLMPKTFYRIGLNQKRRGMPIVACCHYFSRELGQQLAAFCNRVVVHRHYEGLPSNHAVIPLACPVYELEERGDERAKLYQALEAKYPELSGGDQPTLITTCGFVSAWKRFPELVEHLHPLLPENAWLQMLCSPHFSGEHGAEMEKVKRVCAGKSRVILEDRFLPEIEMLDRLALSDLGVLFHSRDTGSVSAATKAMIAARVPLVTTNSSHASDMTSAHRASNEIQGFVRSVVEVSQNFAKLREMKAETQREYERINMVEVAAKYLDIFEGLT